LQLALAHTTLIQHISRQALLHAHEAQLVQLADKWEAKGSNKSKKGLKKMHV